ncbi:MerR family transcriptional regulator, partial [Streptomyces ardesiacus]
DPRVAGAARTLADCIPAELLPAEGVDLDSGNGVLRALYADFAPGQAEAVRQALALVSRGRRS